MLLARADEMIEWGCFLLRRMSLTVGGTNLLVRTALRGLLATQRKPLGRPLARFGRRGFVQPKGWGRKTRLRQLVT